MSDSGTKPNNSMKRIQDYIKLRSSYFYVGTPEPNMGEVLISENELRLVLPNTTHTYIV